MWKIKVQSATFCESGFHSSLRCANDSRNQGGEEARRDQKNRKGCPAKGTTKQSDLNMSDFEDANPFGEDNDHLQPPSPPPVPSLSTTTVPDDDEQEPDPPPPPVRLPQHRQYPGLQPKTGFCCSRDEYLHSGDDAEIQVKATSTSHTQQQAEPKQIVDALKMTDHTSSVYIAYVIRTGVSYIPVASRRTSCEHHVTSKPRPTEICLNTVIFACVSTQYVLCSLKDPLRGHPTVVQKCLVYLDRHIVD